ncbi:MAG: hypothetical protein U0270_43250 [Labilithrix sp.]
MRRFCLIAILTLSSASAACSRGSDHSFSADQAVETTLPAPTKVLQVKKVASLPKLPEKSAFTDDDAKPIFAPPSDSDIILHGGNEEPSLLRLDGETSSIDDYTPLNVSTIGNTPNWAFSKSKKSLAYVDNTPTPEGDDSPGQTLWLKDLTDKTAPPVAFEKVQGYRWTADDKLLLQRPGTISKIDPAHLETPVWSFTIATPVGESQLAPQIEALDNGYWILAYTKVAAKVIRLSDGWAKDVTLWTGADAFFGMPATVTSPASTGKDFMSLFTTEEGQPGTLVQVSLQGAFKVLTDKATTVYGSTADRFLWGTPTGFTVHEVVGNKADIDFEVPHVDFAQLVGDGFIYYETTENDIPMMWRRPDDGKGEPTKLIPSELAGDVRGLGFIPGPKGFFIVANNALWETDFKTGGYKERYPGVTYSQFQPAMNQEPGVAEPAVVVTVKDEGLAIVPVKKKAVVLDHGATRTWAGGWTNSMFLYATDTLDAQGKSHYQLRAVTNEGQKDSPIGPEADELVFHRSGAALSRVLIRQGKDLLSVTVDPSALPPPSAEVPAGGEDGNGTVAPAEPPTNHHSPGGGVVPGITTPTAPAPSPAPARAESGCTVSRSRGTRSAPGFALLGLAALGAARRVRRGRRA